MRFLFAICIAVLLSGMGANLPALAQDENDAREALRSGQIMSYGEISRIVASQFGGRVVGQNLRKRGRSWVYDLKILQQDGRVLSVVMDARTGRVLSRRGGR